MTTRTAISARRWMFCAVTGLFLFHSVQATAQSENGGNAQTELKSAVQKQLDALYSKQGKQAPNMMPGGSPGAQSAPTPTIRQTAQQPAAQQPAVRQTAAPSAAPAERRAAPAQSNGAKSDIQRKLEEMYARDGREMPQMNMHDAVESVQQEQSPEVESEPAEVVAEEPKKPSFMQRMNPFKGRQKLEAEKKRAIQNGPRAGRMPQQTQVDPVEPEPAKKSRFVPGFLKRREPDAPREMPQPRTAEALADRPRRPEQSAAPRDAVQLSPARTRSTRIDEPAESEFADSEAEEAAEEAMEEKQSAPLWDEAPANVSEQPGRAKAAARRNPLEQNSPTLELGDEPKIARQPSAKKSFDPDRDETPARVELKAAPNEPLEIERAKAPSEKSATAKSGIETTKTAPSTPEKTDEATSSAPFVEDFDDPFTEVSEKAADGRLDEPAVAPVKHTDKKPEVQAEAKKAEPVDDNPFTGLTLDEASEIRAPKLAKSPATTAPVELKSASEVKKEPELMKTPAPAVEPKSVPAIPRVAAAVPKLEKVPDMQAPKPLPAAKAAAMPASADPLERAKLRRLSSRRGMTGLKGFCPVALREQRDLVDVRAEFRSTFEGQEYQFSSAQAKREFDSEPEKYIPARGGCDVVVEANSHQSVEGSLDHAVWFRDRLYLFSTPESLETFVLNPVEYARD